MKKILLVILLFLLSGCSIGQIADTNGDDDYSIETISNDEIIDGTSSFSVGSLETSTNGVNKYKVNKFSGVKTIDTFRLNNSIFTIEVDCTVSSGNFMLALTTDKKIVKEFNINSSDSFTINNFSGTYYLKIVGESAKFNITYSTE